MISTAALVRQRGEQRALRGKLGGGGEISAGRSRRVVGFVLDEQFSLVDECTKEPNQLSLLFCRKHADQVRVHRLGSRRDGSEELSTLVCQPEDVAAAILRVARPFEVSALHHSVYYVCGG